jgi:hypothetical protein
MDKFTVIDDFIPLTYQREIETLLLSPQFPWYYTKDVTYSNDYIDNKKAPALSHLLKERGSPTSQYFSFFLPMAYVASEFVKMQFNDVLRCRTFLQLPLNESFVDLKVDSLHIDDSTRHLVLLYYVLDADGDTIIVDKEFINKEEKNLKHTFCFSGENYVNNVNYQINYFKEKTKNSNHSIKVIYPKESINILVDYILKNVLGKIK